MANLHAHNRCGVILSWARLGQQGTHHVNNHRSAYVKDIMKQLGYVLDDELTKLMRLGNSTLNDRTSRTPLPWLRYTVLAFRRIHAHSRSSASCGAALSISLPASAVGGGTGLSAVT